MGPLHGPCTHPETVCLAALALHSDPGIEMPNPESTCCVRYSSAAVGGGRERTVLEEVGMGGDVDGKPAEFVQGDRELLPCIEMAVVDMKVGEKARRGEGTRTRA